MALKTCDRCKNKISDRAIWCPHCKELKAVIYLDINNFTSYRNTGGSREIKQYQNENVKNRNTIRNGGLIESSNWFDNEASGLVLLLIVVIFLFLIYL